MEVTRLSSKGQVIIPKSIRNLKRWLVGQEFIVEETEEGILLKPKKPFAATTLDAVAGCLVYSGQAKSIEEMNRGIDAGLLEQWHDSD